jgi:hypothetical protein
LIKSQLVTAGFEIVVVLALTSSWLSLLNMLIPQYVLEVQLNQDLRIIISVKKRCQTTHIHSPFNHERMITNGLLHRLCSWFGSESKRGNDHVVCIRRHVAISRIESNDDDAEANSDDRRCLQITLSIETINRLCMIFTDQPSKSSGKFVALR